MKFFLLIVFTSIFNLSSYAQSSKNILDKVYDIYSKSNGIKASFDFISTDKQGQTSVIKGAEIKIKGRKIKQDLGDLHTWYDGKTLWSLSEESDEVNITEPDKNDPMGISSVIINYKKLYTIENYQDKIINGHNSALIILKPKNNKTNEQIVNLYIDKSNYSIVKLDIFLKDKSKAEFNINKYTTYENYQDSIFTFDNSKYPNVEEIDLR